MSTGLLSAPLGAITRLAPALVLGTAIATAPSAQPAATNGEGFALERALPSDTFAFATFAGLDALAGAGEELGLYKLFCEPDVQGFFRPLLEQYASVTATLNDDQKTEWRMIKGLLRGRLSIGLSGLTALWTRDGVFPVPAAAVTLELGDRRDAFDQLVWPMLQSRVRGLEQHDHELAGHAVRELRFTHPRGPRMSIYSTYVGSTLLVATSRPLFERCLSATGAAAGDSLAAAPSFRRARSKLGTAAMTELFVNIDSFSKRLRGLMPAEWLAALERLGVDQMGAIYHASGVDQGDGRDVVYVDVPAPRKGLWTATEKPLDRKLLEFVPAEANALLAGRSDDRLSWKMVEAVLSDVIPAREFAMMRKELDREMRPFGMAFLEQLLDAFGDQSVIYADVPKSGVIPNVVGSFAVRDAAKMEGILAMLLEGAEVKVREVKSGDTTMKLLTLPGRVPVRPAYAIVGNRLVVSISLNGLRNALRRVDGGVEGSILESPAFAEAFRNLDHQGANSVMFADAKTIARYGYNFLETMLPTWVDEARAPVDPAMMPLADTLTKHLHGWGCVGRWDGDGHVTTMCAPVVPGGLLPLIGLFLHRAEGNPIEVLDRMGRMPPPRREG